MKYHNMPSRSRLAALSTLLLILALPCRFALAELPAQHFRLTRVVAGWLPSWENKSGAGAGWQVVRTHLNMIDQVSLFSAEADSDTGALTLKLGAPDSALVNQIATLHTNDIQVILTVTHFNHIHELLNNPAALARIQSDTAAALDRYELDGVDIDFEDFKDKDSSDTAKFSAFMEGLANNLHKRTDSFGFPLTVIATILSRTARGHFTYEDEAALAASDIDQIRVMAYDEYSPGSSKAGACAPLLWVATVADYLRSASDKPWKFIVGIPGYGYRWPIVTPNDLTTTGKGVSVTFPKAVALMAHNQVPKQWDDQQAAPYFKYDSDGQHVIAYYEDSESWFRKVDQIVATDGGASGRPLGGMAEWALGYEDPLAWHRIQRRMIPTYNIYGAIGLCYNRFGGGARFGEPRAPEEDCGASDKSSLNGRAGRDQRFFGTTFYYQWEHQRAYYVEGEMLRRYEAEGGPSGKLGFPTADTTVDLTGTVTQKFEHGSLSYLPAVLKQPTRTGEIISPTEGMALTACAVVAAMVATGKKIGKLNV